MIRDIMNFKKINPQLVKSLQRYIFTSVFIITFILFASQLFYLDSFRYYSEYNNRVMISELDKIEMRTYDNAVLNLNNTVNMLSKMGSNIEYHEVVLETNIEFLNTPKYMYYDVLISDNGAYLDLITIGLTWEFKRDLSPRGIYVSKTAYEKLAYKNTVQIKLDDSSDIIEVVIDGVYEYNVPNFIFYSYSDRDSFNKVLMNKKILEDVTIVGSLPAENIIQTKDSITPQDLKHFELFFEEPITGLQNYYDSVTVIKGLLDKLNELIWLVSGILFILSFIMIYRYFVELKYVLRTYYLFYSSKRETFLMQITSGLLVIVKPFVIPIVFFTVSSIIVYVLYDYLILNIVYVLFLLALFFAYILLFSFVQSFSNFSEN